MGEAAQNGSQKNIIQTKKMPGQGVHRAFIR